MNDNPPFAILGFAGTAVLGLLDTLNEINLTPWIGFLTLGISMVNYVIKARKDRDALFMYVGLMKATLEASGIDVPEMPKLTAPTIKLPSIKVTKE